MRGLGAPFELCANRSVTQAAHVGARELPAEIEV